MKIRKGFVSNSSSSSFVVVFPHKPESAEETREMMFGKQEWHYAGRYATHQDVSTVDISKAVFDNISEQSDRNQVYSSIRNGWFGSYLIPEIFPGHYDGEPLHPLSFPKDEKRIREIWDERDRINDQRASEIADAFIKEHKDKFITVMTFSDNDGEFESMLEHSKIFNRLKHIQTSYH
jgi:hypothetical protein